MPAALADLEQGLTVVLSVLVWCASLLLRVLFELLQHLLTPLVWPVYTYIGTGRFHTFTVQHCILEVR